VRKSLDPPRPLADGEAARLVLVPSEARPGDVLYERVAPVVNRMIWLYLATDPERDDIAQDVFVAIVKHASSVRDAALLEGWAARVCFNTISNVFRRRKLLRWLSLDALHGYEPPARDADFEGRELVARAQRLLAELPVSERMAFTLRLLENANMDEIARLCGCSERTLRRRLKSARARFLRLVERDPALASRLSHGVLREEPLDG
jgi:RNA polymerase sigma-70 factor, ECF subfamily